jgi:hypothetical protein
VKFWGHPLNIDNLAAVYELSLVSSFNSTIMQCSLSIDTSVIWVCKFPSAILKSTSGHGGGQICKLTAYHYLMTIYHLNRRVKCIGAICCSVDSLRRHNHLCILSLLLINSECIVVVEG